VSEIRFHLLLGGMSQAKQFRMLYYPQRKQFLFVVFGARLDEEFFSDAIESFFGQRWLTPV